MTALAEMDWVEFTGLASGLVCVWLLIRQNVWTFPIGLVYAVVSVVVFLEQRLYADVLLSAYYVVMNGYGWYYWLRGGERASEDSELPVSAIPRATSIWLSGLVAVGVAAMGWFFASQTDADLPYWDSATTVMSFAAMWMTARKYIENWIVWWVVDVIATVMYVHKGVEFYAMLYAIYLGMAIVGWRTWRRTQTSTASSA